LKGDEIVPIGTELFHVGSLLGQVGSNSMTRGIMSKVGRQIKTRRLSESDRKGFHLNLITFVWGFVDWGKENRVKWL